MAYWSGAAAPRLDLDFLGAWRLDPPAPEVEQAIRRAWDRVAKPLDAMGDFEAILARIGAINRDVSGGVGRKALAVFCADNGIVEEGISQSGQEITLAVARSLGLGRSSAATMAKALGVRVFAVDVGINSRHTPEGVEAAKVAAGTANFLRGPAMEPAQAWAAMEAGWAKAGACKRQGYQLAGVGEMGIGNTATAAALSCALLGRPAWEMVGRGAGLSDAALARKTEVVESGLSLHGLGAGPAHAPAEAFRALCCVGGLDIAAMAGFYIGSAMVGLPAVADGLISLCAALLAQRLLPGAGSYVLASHQGKEPAVAGLLEALGLSAPLGGNMALGEGCGALMYMALLDVAQALYIGSASFDQMDIEAYRRWQ